MFKGKLKTLVTRALSNPLGSMLMRPLWGGRAVIFMAHRLSARAMSADCISIDSLSHSIVALRKAGAKFVSLSHLFELAARGQEPAPGSVAFTLDDGFADQGVMAREGFLRNDCPVTIFLISGFIDGKLWPWDDQITCAVRHAAAWRPEIRCAQRTWPLQAPKQVKKAISGLQDYCKSVPWPEADQTLQQLFEGSGFHPTATPPAGYQSLSWQEIRDLESEGVDFGPHSVTHRITSQLSAEEVQEEISGSWQRLRQELKRPVPIYAWPTGRPQDFGTRDMQIAARLGLTGAVAVQNNYAEFRSRGGGQERFAISRFPLSSAEEDNLQYGTAIERVKQLIRLHW